MSVRIAGIGIGRFGRRTESGVELATEAGLRAMEDVGRKPIDLLVVGNMLGEVLEERASPVPRLASRLGLETAAGLRVEAASATGAAAFHAGAAAVASGRSDRALVVAYEKLTGAPTPVVARALSRALAPEEVAVGATMPALSAIIAQLYVSHYHVPLAAFDRVSVHMRAQAARNAAAQFTKPVTEEEVARSRVIASPLRLLHCAAISDGAVALALERGDDGAVVRGMGQGLDAFRVVDRPALTRFIATRTAATRAYEMAHVTPKELEVAEIHDAFAPFALIDLEDLGLADEGTAAQWFEGGKGTPSGPISINPSGGVLGRGHPVGASGLVEIAEVASQIRREAGSHQLDRPVRLGLAQSIGGLASHNFVTILGQGSAPS